MCTQAQHSAPYSTTYYSTISTTPPDYQLNHQPLTETVALDQHINTTYLSHHQQCVEQCGTFTLAATFTSGSARKGMNVPDTGEA